MQATAIEQFVLDELTNLREENKDLKAQLANIENRPQTLPTLGIYYTISNYRYNLQEENRFRKMLTAYKEKDFKYLNNHDYSVGTNSWNFELKILNEVIKLNVCPKYSGEGLSCSQVEPTYYSREEAENALLEQLREDLIYIKDNYLKNIDIPELDELRG